MAKRSLFDLNRALKFFVDSSFLSIAQSGKIPLYYQYGANGGLLLHNFLSEWFIGNIANKEKVSMVSTSMFTQNEAREPRHSLSQGCHLFYDDLFNLHSGKFPFGAASSGRCVAGGQGGEDSLEVLGMQRPVEWTECLVQYFVSEKLVTDTLHRIEVDHLTWWKKLSNSKDFIPKRLETNGSSISGHIVYTCPHGDTAVENLHVSGPHTELTRSPYIIECKISADVAVMTLLHDAYTESSVDGQLQQQLKFHQRLAPYKLGILYEGINTTELDIIADHIKEELRKEAILIQTSHNSSDHSRLQRSGVPYAVLLSDQTLLDGSVLLQDLGALTNELVHVTDLKQMIVKYVN